MAPFLHWLQSSKADKEESSGAKILHMAATQEGSWDGESEFYENADAAFAAINAKLLPGDVVLVKSSNSSGLRFLGDRLAGVA